MSHPCAIEGCKRPAKDGQLMCWPHWRRVPKVLNRAVFETFQRACRGFPGASQEYSDARSAAISAVTAKEQNWDFDL